MGLELVSKDVINRRVIHATKTEEVLTYMGPERRREPRRIMVDRRELVRFEAKSDRRVNRERRIDLQLWDGRYSGN